MSESNKALVKIAAIVVIGYVAYKWYWDTFKKTEAITSPPTNTNVITGIKQ